MEALEPISRRAFVRVGGVGSVAAATLACALTAAPAPGGEAPSGTAKTGWEKEWDGLVGAAKKEGTLALVTTAGGNFRNAADEFEKAFPGVRVELTSMIASTFGPRVLQERKGSIYNYDVFTSTYGTVALTMIPEGALDPVRPLIFRPDVLDDKSWQGGFERGFLDNDEKWAYGGFAEVFRAIWVNSDIIKEGEIKTFDDLLNPKYKGKIVSGDPRNHGGGWWPATALRLRRGEAAMRKFYKDQELVFSRDQRQMMDFIIKGTYWFGSGPVLETLLADYNQQGVGQKLKYIPIDELDNLNHGSNVVYYFNRSPHPNAAKLFINWVLTKDGAALWAKHAETNSRRTDVAPSKPENAPDPKRNLIEMDRQELQNEWVKTQDLAKAWFS